MLLHGAVALQRLLRDYLSNLFGSSCSVLVQSHYFTLQQNVDVVGKISAALQEARGASMLSAAFVSAQIQLAMA